MLNPEPSIIRDPIVNYNNFFSPYICHLCKISANLEVCQWCRLISYCCQEHLELHRVEHQEFCLAVVSLSVEIFNTQNITLKEWNEFNKVNLERVKHKLGRNLERYEEQILLFAKSCRVCYRQNDLSVVCNACMSVTMCCTHNSIPYVHSCAELRLCIKLDIENTVTNEDDITISVELVDYLSLRDMKTHIQRRLGRHRNFETWNYADFLYTDCLSKPLTLLFYIQRANICDLKLFTDFVIHIIAGTFTDQNSLLAWEAFLHQMIPGSTLYIIMIEPCLEQDLTAIRLCQNCRAGNKDLFFVYCGMTYKNYRRTESYLSPDIIVGFDIDFKDDKMAVVTALLRQEKSLVLTCKSESKAQEIVTEIGTTYFKVPIINEKNKFASCRPYRDVESDSVFFLNQHLIMYLEADR
ncbi:uncharacterized protein LOC116846897 isoform X1 [Odontomachus brunneus]|uniref:uncharacterized protein LOC116846897 isoform X1 n=1 Tax=Odontomachus brunneus TaxID=486640 RepID=UPI0013F272E1|nr:uncharacterized protein LOC116846897 isoform X1 [Odontomachus brunneus]